LFLAEIGDARDNDFKGVERPHILRSRMGVADMTGMYRGISNELTGLEDQLAAMLSQTTSDISRSESLDDEQRAEIYEIVEALKAETFSHTVESKKLIKLLGKGHGDA
jgi:hypothetical protein